MGGIFSSGKGAEKQARRQADIAEKAAAVQKKDLQDKAAGAQMMQEATAARAAATQAAEDLANVQPREKLNLDMAVPTDPTLDETGKRVLPRQRFKVNTPTSSGIKL